ncbi:6-aminohexanoate hydrolase [Bacillus sp. LL01]|uniref:amidase family protein n=1 Tax=Bacillus sp. LL01 TaxID=1665556 RepID=UPI00064CF7CA|nr:amidase family protein [Bacillus sp. LL01]KMJ57397.1 6-aminohexanoate hydrolase [Bacillus sp. LL01]
MKKHEYKNYDGLGLAELVQKKEVKPIELLEMAVSEIETQNPQLNAVIHTMYEKARVAAVNATSGQFAGVPILLKDIGQEVKGEPKTLGSRALVKYRAKKDSEYVKRLRNSGFLPLGHTNVPEFGLMAITEPVVYGPARNPWKLSHTPGGSSGGSAAAVASGMVPIAGANDGGGSIRIPAAYCGLFGLKPTRGRTPVGPQFGRFWQGAAVEHVLTKTVRDSAAVLDDLKGNEKGAAFSTPMYEGSYLDKLQHPLEKKLRIAYSTRSPIGTEVHPDCVEAVRKTLKYLESSGHTVEEVEAPVDGKKIANSYLSLYFGEVSASVSMLEEILGRKATLNDVEPATWLLALIGKSMSAQEFVLSLREWDIAAYAMEDFHETYDLYVTPTTAFPPPRIGDHKLKPLESIALQVTGKLGSATLLKKMGIVEQLVQESLKRVPFTQLANLTGQPAMSLPVHVTQDGLPVGVQFMAARGNEEMLLQMARLVEESELWVGTDALFAATSK